jgi:benzodiazapine receptor
MKKYLQPLAWIAAFQAISAAIGMITNSNMEWYQSLARSALTPPNIVFPIVWSTLYVMLALAGYLMWRVRKLPEARVAFILFWVQMLMNWAWSFVFFEFKAIELGYYWIVALNVLMLIFIISALKIAPKAALLVVPTLLWGCFAAYLNYMIWILN